MPFAGDRADDRGAAGEAVGQTVGVPTPPPPPPPPASRRAAREPDGASVSALGRAAGRRRLGSARLRASVAKHGAAYVLQPPSVRAPDDARSSPDGGRLPGRPVCGRGAEGVPRHDTAERPGTLAQLHSPGTSGGCQLLSGERPKVTTGVIFI